MGSIASMVLASSSALSLCALYSGLDIKYGEQGFWCWGAIAVLVLLLAGGFVRAAASLALLVGGKAVGHEPLAVLLVSLIAGHAVHSYAFVGKVDDTQVSQRPYEQEIRNLLFVNDPGRLHLVDAELNRYRGREKQLLREYRRKYKRLQGSAASVGSPAPSVGAEPEPYADTGSPPAQDEDTRVFVAERSASVGGLDVPDSGIRPRKSLVQQAHEEESRRVQESIRQSLQRISDRMERRR